MGNFRAGMSCGGIGGAAALVIGVIDGNSEVTAVGAGLVVVAATALFLTRDAD